MKRAKYLVSIEMLHRAAHLAEDLVEKTSDGGADDLNKKANEIADQLGELLKIDKSELSDLIDDEKSPEEAVAIANLIKELSDVRREVNALNSEDRILSVVSSLKTASPRVQELFKIIKSKKPELKGQSLEAIKKALENVPLVAARWGEALGTAIKSYFDGVTTDVQLVGALEKVDNMGNKRSSRHIAANPELEAFMDEWFSNPELENVLKKELGPDAEHKFKAIIDFVAEVFNGGLEQWIDNGMAERDSDVLLDMYNSDNEAREIPLLVKILDIFKEAYDLAGGDWENFLGDQQRDDTEEAKWERFCEDYEVQGGSDSDPDDYFTVGDTDCAFSGENLSYENLLSTLQEIHKLNSGEIMNITITGDSGDTISAEDDSDIDRIVDEDILGEIKGMGDQFKIEFEIRIGGDLNEVRSKWDDYLDLEHVDCQSVYHQGNSRSYEWSEKDIHRFSRILDTMEDTFYEWEHYDEKEPEREHVEELDALDSQLYALGSAHDLYAAAFQWVEITGALPDEAPGMAHKSSSKGVDVNSRLLARMKSASSLKPFDEMDWSTFAGASELPSGQEPMLGEVKLADWPRDSEWDKGEPITEGVVIVSGDEAGGAMIQILDTNADDGMFMKEGMTEEEAVALGNRICSGTQTPRSLIDAGLTPQFDDETMEKLNKGLKGVSKFEIEKSLGRMSSKRKKADIEVTKLIIDGGQLLQLEAEAENAADTNDFNHLDNLYDQMDEGYSNQGEEAPASVEVPPEENETEVPTLSDEEEGTDVVERDKE